MLVRDNRQTNKQTNFTEKMTSVAGAIIQAWRKSLMAKWLEQASQWHEMYCYDLEVMSSNPGRVEVGVHSISVLKSYLIQKYNMVAAEHVI